ncbi:MAG TPA: DUF883 family protein [Candidatus Acidoferrum sp.]|nr:DUF883 family protein [Candidatus Acidoferrum sp.]
METVFENMERSGGVIARERALRHLKMLAREAEGLMKVTAGDLSDTARQARARLGTALESARQTCSELQDQVVASARKADSVVRENPYACVGVAFGLGCLIGVLVARK